MSLESTPVFSQTDIPTVYFNGFELRLSNSDVSIAMLINGRPQLAANMSFTTVKSLHQNLALLIDALERATDRTIMTMDDVAVGLAKISEQQPIEGEKRNG